MSLLRFNSRLTYVVGWVFAARDVIWFFADWPTSSSTQMALLLMTVGLIGIAVDDIRQQKGPEPLRPPGPPSPKLRIAND